MGCGPWLRRWRCPLASLDCGVLPQSRAPTTGSRIPSRSPPREWATKTVCGRTSVIKFDEGRPCAAAAAHRGVGCGSLMTARHDTQPRTHGADQIHRAAPTPAAISRLAHWGERSAPHRGRGRAHILLHHAKAACLRFSFLRTTPPPPTATSSHPFKTEEKNHQSVLAGSYPYAASCPDGTTSG